MKRTWLGVFLCVLAGCQQGTGTSSGGGDANAIIGKVYLGTDLVNYGAVSFIGPNNKTMKSIIATDGSYKIRNAPPGEYVIVVVTGPVPLAAGGGGNPKNPPPVLKRITIPNKYASGETTDLKYRIEEGQHTYDIKMTVDKKENTEPTDNPKTKGSSDPSDKKDVTDKKDQPE